MSDLEKSLVRGRALEMAMREAAFSRGYSEPNLLANPYPENSDEARHFVDGWVQAQIDARQGNA